MRSLLSIVIASSILFSCDTTTDLTSPKTNSENNNSTDLTQETPLPAILTDTLTYRIENDKNANLITFTVNSIYKNTTDRDVFISLCAANTVTPLVQHYEDGVWQTVYQPVCQMTLFNPLKLYPGEQKSFEWNLKGGDGRNPKKAISPKFNISKYEGSFRLLLPQVYFKWNGFDADVPFEGLVGEVNRASNIFELKEN